MSRGDGTTAEAAVYQFLSGFGIPAYASTSVPTGAKFPYLTYDLTVGDWMGGDVSVPVNVWYRTDSEAAPNAKVREIHDAIGMGGVIVPCDGGALWIKRGSPWAQSVLAGGEDEKIKRRYVNLDIDYMTT